MKKNDIIPLEITDMSVQGEGIGHFEGMAFFVKGAITGDVTLCGITKLKKNYGYARIVEMVRPSPHRVKPVCPEADNCGGCQIMQMEYSAQLSMKEHRVKNDLLRIGKFSKAELEQAMAPIIGMEEPYEYRNKAQYPVGRDRFGNRVMGFYATHSHRIVEHSYCFIGQQSDQEILSVIRTYMQEVDVTAYDEETHKGLIRHVLIRHGMHTGQIMVTVVINGKKLPESDKLCRALFTIPGMQSVSVNINYSEGNTVLGRETYTLQGTDTIEDTIGDVKFRISPRSFFQVNYIQTERLYHLVKMYAALTGKETVWDIYCGIGTIGQYLAKDAGYIYGIEIVPEAVEDAKENAALNGLSDKTEYFLGKAEEVLPAYYAGKLGNDAGEGGAGKGVSTLHDSVTDGLRTGGHPDVMIVDPPRKGCEAPCLHTMLSMKPEKIIYVSCNPSTLARDLRILCDGGYTLQAVTPVDQFPHTFHVETVCLMSRVEK